MMHISIHVPRVGDDTLRTDAGDIYKVFLSTSPAWGTTIDFLQSVLGEIFLSTSPAWGTTHGGPLGVLL